MFSQNDNFKIVTTQIHCETSIYYLEWKIRVDLLIYQNGKERFSYNVFSVQGQFITDCKSRPYPPILFNFLFRVLITRTKQNVPLPFIFR